MNAPKSAGVFQRWLVTALTLTGLLGGGAFALQAQDTVLVPWISVWTYETSGLHYDSGWRELNYDDSAWPSGPAPLGFGAGESTPLGSISTGTVFPDRGAVTTLFRHRFTFGGDPSTVSLVVSNFADDGALVFINGTRVADFGGIDNGLDPVTGDTLSPRGGEAATRVDVVSVAGTVLNVGDNVVAVEVHQATTGSSDVTHGTALSTVVAVAPVFTLEPQDELTVVEGEGVTLTSQADGSPEPTYQWFRDADGPGGSAAVPILGATGPAYTLVDARVADSGFYFVRATGHGGTVQSRMAELRVSADVSPPVLLSAVGQTDLRTVVLTFDEALSTDPMISGAEDPFIYTLLEVGGFNYVFFSMAVVTNGNEVILTTTEPWNPVLTYELELFEGAVTDLFGNAIVAPNNVVPMRGAQFLIDWGTTWEYDQSNTDFGTAWLSNSAPPFPNVGPGLLGQEFVGDAVPLIRTDLMAPNEGGPNSHYFRTRFLIPDRTSVAALTASYFVDDEAVIYINGTEVHRTAVSGMPIPGIRGEPVPHGTQAPAAAGDAVLTEGIHIPLGALVDGINVMQVYVAQAGGNSSDVVWGLRLSAIGCGQCGGRWVQQPPPIVNLLEFEDFTLSAWYQGFPPLTYQWRVGGVDIPGATNTYYAIAGAVPSHSGVYSLAVTDAIGIHISDDSIVTVGGHSDPIVVLSAISDATPGIITLTLDSGVTEESATDLANYSLRLRGNGSTLPITGITFDPGSPNVVVLSTPGLIAQFNYDLTVAGLTDLAQTPNVMPPTTVPVTARVPIFGTGRIWSYDQRNLDLGTAWRGVAFDDSAWPRGPSMLGFEANQIIATPLQSVYNDGVVSNTVPTTTYYFRTRLNPGGGGPCDSVFDPSAIPSSIPIGAVALYADVDYDDGFVMYLDGIEVARGSMPQTGTNLNHFSLASSHESGRHETFYLGNVNLRQGEHVLAVEVHQTSIGSSDMVLDVRLSALVGTQSPPTGIPACPRVSLFPVSGVINEGGTATFNVTSAGAVPQTFEWFRDGVPVGTGSILVIANATPADSGNYTVTATNADGSGSSDPVALTVQAETDRPRVVSCVGHGDGVRITITFSEELDPGSSQDPGNYIVEGSLSGGVAVSGAVLSSDGRSVVLTTGLRNSGEGYVVTISGVRDDSFTGNRLDPDPTVCDLMQELLAVSDDWRYIEDDVPQPNDWFAVGFDDSGWAVGGGIFGYEVNLGDAIVTRLQQTYTNTVTEVTNETKTTTYYFRAHFGGARHVTGNELHLIGRYDDGVVVYLNGVEAVRAGLSLSRTSTNTAEEVHFELSTRHESDVIEDFEMDASLLLPGDNVITVELHQNIRGSSDAVMGFGVFSVVPGCEALDPTIVLNGDGSVTVSWTGPGELWAATAVDGVYAPTGQGSPYTFVPGARGRLFFRVICP